MPAGRESQHQALSAGQEEARLRRAGNLIVIVAAVVMFGGVSLLGWFVHERQAKRSAGALLTQHREGFLRLSGPAALSEEQILRLLEVSSDGPTVMTKLPVPLRREELVRDLGQARTDLAAGGAQAAGLGWLAQACTREFEEILLYESDGAGAAYFVGADGRVVGIWLGRPPTGSSS